ncbi:hypothetical protein ACFLU2_01810 [Chloroflexota bacterium]
MMIRVNRGYTLFLLVIITVTMLLGCSPTEQEPFWGTYIEGDIVIFRAWGTDGLEDAQKEVPFNIIVPTYLPHNLDKYPAIIGPVKEAWLKKERGLEMHYKALEGIEQGQVEILEYNWPVTGLDPGLNLGHVYVEIAGVEVVEKEHNLSPIISGKGQIDLWGYVYWWSQDNIYFEVAVYGYDHSEAIKVVESMVLQMQH